VAAKPTAVSREFELTPSASKFRLAIFDWSQTKMRDQQRAKEPPKIVAQRKISTRICPRRAFVCHVLQRVCRGDRPNCCKSVL